MRSRCTGRSEMGRKGGQNGLSCAIFSAYSTRVNAGIAQLVEQLICNQQVVGSNPTAGSPPKNSRLLCDSQISQRVIDRPCTGSRWLREDANSVPPTDYSLKRAARASRCLSNSCGTTPPKESKNFSCAAISFCHSS